MPFTIIKGTFHVVGYSPDGDSIRFLADNGANWIKLGCPIVGLNGRDHAQLRLEGIDTLETHYENFQQPPTLARAAMNNLLALLNIKNAVWNINAKNPVVTQAEDGTHGYILARSADKYQRPISFVFAGETDLKDGNQKVELKGDLLKQSVNYQMLEAGLAYPTYYNGLFFDLRDVLTEAVNNARTAHAGIWQVDPNHPDQDLDKTNDGFVLRTIDDVTKNAVILPKLFRRIIGYYINEGKPAQFTHLDKFKKYLDTNPDAVLQLGLCHFTHLSTFVKIDTRTNTISFTENPENLVFME